MGRLIDADKLIEAIVNRPISETVLFNTTKELNAYLDGCAYKQLAILEMIDDMPTVYDLEKMEVFGTEIEMVRKKVQHD